MTQVADRITALSPDQRKLLLDRLRRQVGRATTGGAGGPTAAGDWLVRHRQVESHGLQLFCLSYAGGGASVFRAWADALPPEVAVFAVQLPGRESRIGEPAYRRIDTLVETLAAVVSEEARAPFALYGHSMGGLVSFELARRLRREHGLRPVCLYIGAYRAPQLPNRNLRIHHLPAEVFKVVLRAQGIPDAVLQDADLMEAMLPTLRADFELCDRYEYREEPPLECPILVFGGADDLTVGADDLDGWSAHSSASCEINMLPGGHFFIHSSQEELLAAISRDLRARLGTDHVRGPREAGHLER